MGYKTVVLLHFFQREKENGDIITDWYLEESNSSGIYGEGSKEPSSSYNSPQPKISPLIIYYKKRNIQVSFHIQNGHLTPANCQVLGQHDGIPTIRNKEHINFITRALMYEGIRYCVVYETGNGVVLGAKLPPILADQKYTGDPMDFNPDESKCFITYGGLDFVVKADPHTGNPSKMELLPKNISNPSLTYIYTYDVKPVHVVFGGLYFVLHQRHRVNGKPDNKIVGADLDPNWRDRLPQSCLG